jgi:cell division inhibitor SepF
VGLREAGVWLGLVEDEDQVLSYDDHPDGDAYADDESWDQDSRTASGFRIATVRPQNFRDAMAIGEHFRQDVPVIINLQDMDAPDAKRIVDFASGLIFGRRGEIERVSSRIFLILPPGYSILKDGGTPTDEGFFNQT